MELNKQINKIETDLQIQETEGREVKGLGEKLERLNQKHSDTDNSIVNQRERHGGR